jgi:hypothetical protein
MYRRLGPLSELSPEDRRYYRLWWRKYTGLKLVAQIGLPVCLICGILSFGEQAVSHVARVIVHPTIWITVGCTLWWTFLDCPRCGAKFTGWWGSEFNVWNLSECQECQISFGSSRRLWSQYGGSGTTSRGRRIVNQLSGSTYMIWADWLGSGQH